MADINAQLPTVISQSDDSILIYGWDGAANQKILTDNTGKLQIDIDSMQITGGTIDSATIEGFNVDQDDGGIADSQTSQLVINENYLYNSTFGGWRRQLSDANGNAMSNITDGNDELDIVGLNDPLDTGIVTYGYDGAVGRVRPIPLETPGIQLAMNNVLPIAGHDYNAGGAGNVIYMPKVDSNGHQYIDTVNTIGAITGVVSINDGGNSITVDDGGVSLTVDGMVSVNGFNTDTDDGALNNGQTSQLVINENYGFDSAAGQWYRMPSMAFPTNPGYQTITDGTNSAEVATNFVSFSQNESSNGLFTAAGCYGLNPSAAAGKMAEPHLILEDSGNINYGYDMQSVIPLNYGYNSAGGAWYRINVDTAGNQYNVVTDGTDNLDIVNDGDTLDTGMVAFGYNQNTTVTPIPIWTDSSSITGFRKGVPMAGYDDTTTQTYVAKVDSSNLLHTSIQDPTDSSTQHATHNVRTVSLEEHRIHEEVSWFCNDMESDAAAGNKEWLIRAPSTGYIHLRYHSETSDYCVLKVYENPTLTDTGTGLTEYNNDRNSTTSAMLQCYRNPTWTSSGSLLKSHIIGTNAGEGGTTKKANKFILKQDTDYLFVLAVANSATDVLIDWEWHEA